MNNPERLREACVSWLQANDPNGIWSDSASRAENKSALSPVHAIATVLHVIDLNGGWEEVHVSQKLQPYGDAVVEEAVRYIGHGGSPKLLLMQALDSLVR